MPKKFSTYWYRELPAIGRAFLNNLRDDDLRNGGAIHSGEIIAGMCGYHVAEVSVEGYTGNTVLFRPNRRCKWQDLTLECMALVGLPPGPVPRSSTGGLRHRHCVVAGMDDPAALAKAREMDLPAIATSDGLRLVNLEVASVPGQAKKRCATLL